MIQPELNIHLPENFKLAPKEIWPEKVTEDISLRKIESQKNNSLSNS